MAYGTDAAMAAYLARTGRAIPSGTDVSVAREMGSLWVNSFEFRGVLVSDAQEDKFPRNRSNPSANPTPVQIEYAAYEAGFAYATGIDIFGNGGTIGGQIVREKVDVLEVQYAAPQAGSFADFAESMRVLLPIAYMYIKPWLKRAEAYAVIVGAKRNGCGC